MSCNTPLILSPVELEVEVVISVSEVLPVAMADA